MKAVCWILNKTSMPLNLLGMLGFCVAVINDDYGVLLLAIPFALLGLWFGVKAYRLGVPPRWLWAKSVNDLFDYAVTAVLGYTFVFTDMPLAYYLITNLIEEII